MNNPLASIIIINYNGKEYLDGCLSSLKKQLCHNFEIILVDNGSADDSVSFIRKNYFDFVRIISSPKNIGFAKANNIGIQASHGKYVVLLNNDTTVEQNWLKALVEAVETDDQIGMCASKILFMHDHKTIDSTGLCIYPDGTSKQRGWLEEDQGQFDNKRDVLLPSGCAALYRRNMLEQIGYFDERFFAYCEDTDLGIRARFAGWQCVFVPEAIVYHYYSGSFRKDPLKKIFLIERNRLLLVFKNFPPQAILKSYYYYFIRCVYNIYGLIARRRIITDYLKNVFLWGLFLIVVKAHFNAAILLPGILFEKIKTRKRLEKKEKLSSLFEKYAVSAKKIALNE